MNSCPDTEEWHRLLNFSAKLLGESSQIVFTLVAASLLEEHVSEALDKAVPGSRTDRNVSHWRRVDLLFKIGLLTENVRDALRFFANIRNTFAHQPHATTFDDPSIKDFAVKLQAAMEKECGNGSDIVFRDQNKALDDKYFAATGKREWGHTVARTLFFAYVMLAYYLIWAKHIAPAPNPPKNINDIGKHVCTKIPTVI